MKKQELWVLGTSAALVSLALLLGRKKEVAQPREAVRGADLLLTPEEEVEAPEVKLLREMKQMQRKLDRLTLAVEDLSLQGRR